MPTLMELPALKSKSLKTSEIKLSRSECYEDGEFIVFPNVPVFKEHTREVDDPDSTKQNPLPRISVTFTADDMEAIAENCNSRIEDTGDFPVLCIRHNPLDGKEDRPVVGHAGPFWTDDFGKINPVRAIFTNFYIKKSRREETDHYPRHSVELWPGNDDPRSPQYTQGYFDPISLLGSEAPHLDLGLRYDKKQSGRRSLHYQLEQIEQMETATASTTPGGSNTSVPGMLKKQDRQLYGQAEGDQMDPTATTNAMPAEHIDQILTAIKEVVPQLIDEAFQGFEARIAAIEEKNGLNSLTGEESGLAAGGGDDDAADPMAAMAGGDPTGAGAIIDPEADSLDYAEADAGAGGLGGDEGDDEPVNDPNKQYQKRLDVLETRIQSLQSQVVRYEKGEKQSLRYQKFVEVRDQHNLLLDPDAEMEIYGDLPDDKFDKHIASAPTRYQKGRISLPMAKAGKAKLSYSKADQKKRIELSAIAKDRCLKTPGLQYREALKTVASEHGYEHDE